MHVIIAKVNEVFFDGEAYSLKAPGAAGEMTVLGHHMPLITTLKAGELWVREEVGGEPHIYEIDGGLMEVKGDSATVIL